MTTTPEALRPCPHCGAEPTEHAIEPHAHTVKIGAWKMPDHPGSHVIECGCGAGMIDDTRDAVVARWNRRAALPAGEPAAAPAPAVQAEPVADCTHCAGAGTVRAMTNDRGEDDYEYDSECFACSGTGSADLADAINALPYSLHRVRPGVEVVSKAAVLEIIKARAAPTAQPAPQASAPSGEPADVRATFEAWMRKDSTLPLDADAHGYADFNVALMWHVWQAATKANAPVGALGGGSDANARPGLAGDDSACAHEFALQPSSSILLCCRCGLSETAVRAAQRHAATPQAAPAPRAFLESAAFHNGRFGFGAPENAAFVKGAAWAQELAAQAAPAPLPLTDEQLTALDFMVSHYGADDRVQCLRPLLDGTTATPAKE